MHPAAAPTAARTEEPALHADRTWLAINTIRTLAMDAVERAQSGHPGTPMALAPVSWLLWTKFLRHDPRRPDWPDRDRFVLSCGHASMLAYSLLYLTGYDVSLDDLRSFRQWGSNTPGHPERGHTAGIEVTTGPLGQGIGNAVGMAIAERILAARFNRPGHEVVSHRTWAVVSDGDLMEGVGSEAASIAGHLGLGRLTAIWDDNRITIDGSADLAFTEDVAGRFEAYGWRVTRVNDGNDLGAITGALEWAREDDGRPALIVLRTRIGDPAPTKGGTAKAHGAPLGADEVKKTKAILGWPDEVFHVPAEAMEDGRECVTRGAEERVEWEQRLAAYAAAHPAEAAEFRRMLAGELPEGWEQALPAFPADKPLATRQASQAVLQALWSAVPELVGGSADLTESTGVEVMGAEPFTAAGAGRTFHWGVREHGMAAALNGIAAHGGLRPFGSTFLVFFDYLKPSLRLASLSRYPTIFIGTHDSIGLGEDGPTHQPVEHLAMLRAIPGVVTIRPADAAETAEAWRVALTRREGPTALVLTRQKLPVLDRTKHGAAEGVRRGGYVLWEPDGGPQAVILATGSEVHLALEAAQALAGEGVRVRVVSLPSWELFLAQPEAYREQVLPRALRARVSVEAAASLGWCRFLGDAGEAVALDRFGASAPAERLFAEFGFTPAGVADAVRRVIGRA
ncbi:MAG TPA: transketolase [Gemmatimonadales bacterium]|nr:transketolase [Gemmatimonadales bacterium]